MANQSSLLVHKAMNQDQNLQEVKLRVLQNTNKNDNTQKYAHAHITPHTLIENKLIKNYTT